MFDGVHGTSPGRTPEPDTNNLCTVLVAALGQSLLCVGSVHIVARPQGQVFQDAAIPKIPDSFGRLKSILKKTEFEPKTKSNGKRGSIRLTWDSSGSVVKKKNKDEHQLYKELIHEPFLPAMVREKIRCYFVGQTNLGDGSLRS